MDLEKAYDSERRECMRHITRFYGIPTKTVDLLRNWYLGINSSVRLDGEEGDWFPKTTGLKQGCVMLPSLFNVCIDAMIKKLTGEVAGGFMVGSVSVVDLDFADAVAMFADP